MKVLLIGEYSGFFSNLKQGLTACGVDVTHVANKDGFKQIGKSDYCLYDESKKSLVYKIYSRFIKPLYFKPFYEKYDCVILINMDVFIPRITEKVLKKIKKRNQTIFLSSCGYDYALYKAFFQGKFDYYMFDSNYKTMNRFSGRFFKKYTDQGKEDVLIEKYIDLIVPTAYEYSVGYKNKLSPIILLPFNYNSVTFNDNVVGEKIVFFHGLTREKEKGTDYIVSALNKLKDNYPEKVEVIVDGKMPYEQYKDVIKKTNVVIDQCKSYWYGMNALVSLSMGKVVLSGARDESLNAIGMSREECPIIPIRPDVDDIYDKLERIVLGEVNIKDLGEKGLQYVKKYHNYINIAQQYIDLFRKEQ